MHHSTIHSRKNFCAAPSNGNEIPTKITKTLFKISVFIKIEKIRIAAVHGFALTDEQFLRDCFTVDANNRSTVDEMDMYDDGLGICELGKLSIHQSKIDLAEASNVTNKNGRPFEDKYDQGASSVNCRRETLRPRVKHETNSNNGKSSGNAANDSDSKEQSSNDRVSEKFIRILLNRSSLSFEAFVLFPYLIRLTKMMN